MVTLLSGCVFYLNDFNLAIYVEHCTLAISAELFFIWDQPYQRFLSCNKFAPSVYVLTVEDA